MVSYHCRRMVLIATILFTGCASRSGSIPDMVWPPAPETPRVKLVEILKDETFIKPSAMKKAANILLGKNTIKSLVQPYDVAVDSAGNVYVSDVGAGAIIVFDRMLGKVRTIGRSGKGKLLWPTAVTIDGDRLFVSDARLGKIFQFDLQGELIREYIQPGKLGTPGGLAYHGNTGQLYVVDGGNHRIAVFREETGAFITSFGQRGIAEGEFNFPSHIAIREDRLYVTDAMNFRIQIFTLDGDFIGAFGEPGDAPGYLYRPKGVAVSREGFIFVADSYFDNFQIFDDQGQVYLFVGYLGDEPGRFRLPAGTFMDDDDKFYVVDQGNKRIQVFQFLGGN